MLSDLLAVLWKEFLQFRMRLFDEGGLVIVILALFGVAMPVALASNPMVVSILPYAVVGILIFSSFFFTSLISEGSFSDELNEGTMRMLLTTGVRPAAIFTAKWLALMVRATLLVALTAFAQMITLRLRTEGASGVDLGFMLWGMGLAILISSYTAAVNATISLVVKTSMQLRQFGTVASLLPIVALLGIANLVGLRREALILVSILLVLLTSGAFLVALKVFRSEKTCL